MRITTGMIADRVKKIDAEQFDKELDVLMGIKTRPNGSRYLDRDAERFITAESHSWAELGEAICGRALIQKLRDGSFGMRGGRTNSRFVAAEDAGAGAMGPSQFQSINYWTGITFKVLETVLLEGFQSPEFLGDKLTTLRPGIITNVSRRGRYSPPTQTVKRNLQPNEPIPMGSMDARWIDMNPVQKNAQGLAISSETMLFDGNQGSAVAAVQDMGYQIGWNKEDKCLNPILGIHNTFKYGQGDNQDSTAYDTYRSTAAGPTSQPILPINKLTKELTTDETSLDAFEQLYLGMTDPNTGYPINMGETRDLLVMPTKKMTAARLQRTTSVQIGPRDSTLAVMHTDTVWAGVRLNVHVSQRAYQLYQQVHSEPEAASFKAAYPTGLTATQAGFRTIYGDCKRAFEYREVRPFQSWAWNMTQDPSLAQNDCFMMVVGLEQGSVSVISPWSVIMGIKDS